ncbi:MULTISPECIES: nitronate monooxygenase family protein [unclassified Variovorax]|uniref:NAD(P)H-dependent flavin oxidoreductase n=1 Tax=unclassified Variovorax TaxID=663243 RepID=UPI002575CAF9|nr:MULTISPECIES: nitronate monooxygenase family protein [unclassified Variovorax]MDM0087398.1 nitronate monooxygenase family protein [Variovorax sp. J22G40]MDM0144345.1 nitronate monooxygenase family protein [Variovorax sp. J2P1-31]
MALPDLLKDRLSLPLIGSPLFIISNPELVLAQCLAGVVGSFPALNARPKELLDEWLTQITGTLAAARAAEPQRRIAPFAVNQIIHASNDRLDHDMALCVKHRVPIVITSLSAPTDYVAPIHAYGGLVFHDVTNVRHAKKALEAGVDGLILVCAGAGGHAGTMSPFALVSEVRQFFDGPIALSGSITSGAHVAAARAMGADLAYVGTRFIATPEANAQEGYKKMIVDSAAAEVTYTPLFTGVHGNYLARSIAAAGLDPANLPTADKTSMNFGSTRIKPWKDVWGAGQGVGNIREVLPTADLIARMVREYRTALHGLAA